MVFNYAVYHKHGKLDAILNLALNGGDSFMLWILYSLYTVDRWGIGGTHGQSGCGSEEKNTYAPGN